MINTNSTATVSASCNIILAVRYVNTFMHCVYMLLKNPLSASFRLVTLVQTKPLRERKPSFDVIEIETLN